MLSSTPLKCFSLVVTRPYSNIQLGVLSKLQTASSKQITLYIDDKHIFNKQKTHYTINYFYYFA